MIKFGTMFIQMVRNGEHKCSHKMTPVEEEKTIPEDGVVCSVSVSVKKPASFKIESPKKFTPVQEEVSFAHHSCP